MFVHSYCCWLTDGKIVLWERIFRYLCNNCRMFCTRLVNETVCHKIFASRITDSQPTAIGTQNINPCVEKKKIAIGLIWRKFDLVLYSDFCLSSGRVFCLKYFSYDLCPNISVIMILVWIFVFTVFLVQATLLFTKMVTKSLLHLKMKENGSTQLREIRGPLGNVDEDQVFGILHHVKR